MFIRFKLCLVYLSCIFLISCKDGIVFYTYEVSDILEKTPKQLEKMQNFTVSGTVTSKVNLGFIKALRFSDNNDQDKYIFILGESKTLPAMNMRTNFRLCLYKEFSINDVEILIFAEVINN